MKRMFLFCFLFSFAVMILWKQKINKNKPHYSVTAVLKKNPFLDLDLMPDYKISGFQED